VRSPYGRRTQREPGYPTERAPLKSAVDDATLPLMSDAAQTGSGHVPEGAVDPDFPEPSEPPEATWAVLPNDPKLLGHSAASTPSAHHQRQQALTAVTFVLGAVALVLGFIEAAHVAGAIVGLVGVVLGFYCQLTSENTTQRWADILGTGGAAIGLGLSLAHGGFGY
jgi:hypothetical protein